MPEYKLHYFNITALGEPIRWLLKYGGVEFEDVRYNFEEWEDVKKKMPFGQMPVLEIDGKQFNQSSAICRYFANQFGLAGDNELEVLEIDSIVDTFTDMRLKVSQVAYEQNKEIQEEGFKKLKSETLPLYLGKLNEIAKDGFLACGKTTWADFYVAALKDYLNWAIKDEELIDYTGYKNIQEVCERVAEIPSIKKWLEERPKTMF